MKRSLIWCGITFLLVACGNDKNDSPYYGPPGGGVGVGVVTNNPGNFRGGVCGLQVASEYNQLAASCNQRAPNCVRHAHLFLRQYPGIQCEIASPGQGQRYLLNEGFVRITLRNMGHHLPPLGIAGQQPGYYPGQQPFVGSPDPYTGRPYGDEIY